MVKQTRIRMSAAQFEALPEFHRPVELIDGYPVIRDLPTLHHQRVLSNIAICVSENMPNGEVFIAPVSVKLDDENYYQPDVLWVAGDSQCEVTAEGINGAPELVIEVLSPGTAKHDRGIKFQTYQQHGVREYWIAEPDAAFVEVWVLENGTFTQFGVFDAADSFTSPILGKPITVGDIFPE